LDGEIEEFIDSMLRYRMQQKQQAGKAAAKDENQRKSAGKEDDL